MGAVKCKQSIVPLLTNILIIPQIHNNINQWLSLLAVDILQPCKPPRLFHVHVHVTVPLAFTLGTSF